MTWIVIVAVPSPPLLVAVTVYVVRGDTAVGVPLSSPVAMSKDRPAGKVGLIVQLSTGSPPAVGVTAPKAVPLVRVNEPGT